MIRKKVMEESEKHIMVRWRLHEPARIEAFSDAVMAFAVTLLVVSLEVPKTYSELLLSLSGVVGFAICFMLLMFIWHDQYLFFRRYGLQDTRTIAYNSMLIFVLLVYVYPLKFLFTYLTQGNDVIVNGETLHRFTNGNQVGSLMIIYSTGYIVINLLFVMMHKQVLKKTEQLKLSRLEIFNTNTFIFVYVGMMGIGVVSILLAIIGIYYFQPCMAFSGMIYSVIGIVISIIHKKRKKKMFGDFTQPELDELNHPVNVHP